MSNQPYLNANQQCLNVLATLLEQCSSELYTTAAQPSFSGCIGAHFRHTIEHYQCFIAQINADKPINYDLRVRNSRLENDLNLARGCLIVILDELPKLNFSSKPVFVKDDYSNLAMPSSVARELSFLIAHTQHHTAMIAAMLRLLGCDICPQIGVSLATLNATNTQSAA